MTKRETRPSLLARDATGGGSAQAGFLFQDNFVLANLPRWLANDGFMQLTQEAMGDVEVWFYEPGKGPLPEYFQVKNHDVDLTDFRTIVEKFITLSQSGNYRRFSIICTGISDKLKPFVNALDRIQKLISPYDRTEIGSQSLSQLATLGDERALNHDEVEFLLRYVSIVDDLAPAQEYGDALFRNALMEYFQEFNELPGALVTDALRRLRQMIHTHKAVPLNRRELETALFGPSENSRPQRRPVRVHTIHEIGNSENPEALQLDWKEFWGGEQRSFPPMDVWNYYLVEGLAELKHWIVENRTTRIIQLTGSRRLSSSIAFGSVFSAVSGFQVETWHSSDWWKTNDHANADTPDYGLDVSFSGGTADSIVVSIGIIRDIRAEVEMACKNLALTELPILHVQGSQPIISAQHANRAVADIKQVIHDMVVAAAARQIHLFYAGPAHMALFLGHRLNAIAALVQCYERTSVGVYVPTCTLFT